MNCIKQKGIHVGLVALLMGIVVLFSAGCKKTTETPEEPVLLGNDPVGIVYDYDYNAYNLITIVDQGWLRENMKAVHYSNGDSIPEITGNSDWVNTTEGARCDYNNDTVNAKDYGHLYNWHAAHDTRNLCPEGFHVPVNGEWNKLIDYLGGWAVAGGKMKEKGTTHWTWPNSGANNSSGFTALPGGSRNNGGVFGDDMGTFAAIWSSSNAPTSGYGYAVGMDNEGGDIANNDEMDETWGLSIRCVQNSGSNPGQFIDNRDGKVYKTIEIGTQTWMAENLNLDTAGSWVYNDDEANAATYGRLYDFATAGKVCPEGWHLPDTVEWNKLLSYLGGYWIASGTMKEAGTDHWNSPNYGATNGSGFAALAAGCRIPNSYPSDYYYLKVFANFWTSSTSKYVPTEGVYEQLENQTIMVWPLTDDKGVGYSVRCVKNN
ncbi:MAG: hypothetical protein IH596_10365 [Bacteroidales bacterium]|nr:hypothetical protein [Bacteroidales bacterium]